MSMFRGNAIKSRGSGHYFYWDYLQPYGLAVFSANDAKEVIAASAVPQALKNNLSSMGADSFVSIINVLSAMGYSNWYYEEVKTGGGYTRIFKNPEQVSKLVKHSDEPANNRNSSDLKYRNQEKIIKKINNSKSGCLLSYDAQHKLYCRIFFQKPGEDLKARMPSLKETTMFAAAPRRKSGAKYAYKHSHEDDIGVYVGNADGNSPTSEDFSGMVSAPLKLIYNHNQGVFECFSTFLAVMLEGLDGAELVNHNINTADVDTLKADDFYKEKAAKYMADFQTGLAMPCSLQDNNPFHFGPNIIKANDKERAEKIRVVNRSTQTFERGEVVLIHQIDGENIVIKIATGSPPVDRPPSFNGPWSFTKFLASSDNYFRDSDGKRISPGLEAGKKAWKLWWKSENYKPDEATFRRLYQDHISYQMHPRITSTHPHKHAFTDRINAAVGLGDNDYTGLDGVLYTDISMFWGPVYSAGASEEDPRFADKNQIPAEIQMEGDPDKGASPTENCARILHSLLLTDITDRVRNLEYMRFGTERGDSFSRWKLGYEKDVEPNKPVNDTVVQFSFLSGDLFGHLDQNAKRVNEGVLGTASKSFAKNARDFYNSASVYGKVSKGTNLFNPVEPYYSSSWYGPHTMNDTWNDVFTSKLGGYTGPKYGKYVEQEPLDVGQNTLPAFGDDDNSSTKRWSSALGYGINAARRSMSKTGGDWTLNIETDQTFGLQGEFYGGVSGGSVSLTVLPIGPGVAWASDTRGRVISGTTQVWGSSLDNADSANTGALHVQVWDGWPKEDTLWLGQFFTLLHFNPGSYGSTASKVIEKKTNYPGTASAVDVDVNKYNLDTRVDFRTPTFGALDENGHSFWNAGGDGVAMQKNQLITTQTVVRPRDYWLVNTSSRGRPVTYYGNIRTVLRIGVTGTFTWINKGKGFKAKDIISINDYLKFKVTAVGEGGSITSLVFAKDEDLDRDFRTPADAGETGYEINNTYKGDYTTEFMDGPIVVELASPTGDESASISFTQGKVYETRVWDYGPKTRSGQIRCSKPSTNGQRRVFGTRSTQISVESNEDGVDVPIEEVSPYPGNYELLVHCHNDIGIALHNEPHATAGYQMHNFITMKIN